MSKRLKQTKLFDSFSKRQRSGDADSESEDLGERLQESDEECLIGSDSGDHEEPPEDHEDVSEYCQSACCTEMSKTYQPTDKQTLSSMASGGRNFMARWYTAFPWLTVCTVRKKAFCFYCRLTEQKGILTFSSKAESAFTTKGFNNWRKAMVKFNSHAASSAHAEAIMKWQMLQATPINTQLSTQLQKLQNSRRQALVKQLHCLRYLLRQGLAIRGHTETEGNLYQLLQLMAVYDSEVVSWLEERKYFSPLIVNEQITIMGLSTLRALLNSIKKCSPTWYAIIVDEATDVANREQLNLSIRWVNNDYEINEDPVGLYCLPNTKAETIHFVVLDILTRCSLSLEMCRGQAYDGASNMQGVRTGLATRIKKDYPAALSVHCLAHCLNLCLQEEGRKLPFIRDALDTVKEIAKLIKFSPKRSHLFSQKQIQSETPGVNIKPLCPTRWTARTGAIEAILSEYTVLMDTLDEVHQTTKDEYVLKAAGLLSAMEKFSTLFGLKLGYLIFGASETLSRSLQGKDTSIQEAISAVSLAKSFYKRQRTENAFQSFYDDVVITAQKLKIGEPQLPRYRRVPRRLDDGSQPHRYSTPKEYFRHQFFEACDLLISELDQRFDQQQLLSPVLTLENLLLEASNGHSYQNHLDSLKISCYKNDFNSDRLHSQLSLCADMIKQALPTVKCVTSVRTICEAMNTNNTFKSMLSEVHDLLRLYLTVPITSATSERSFSALRFVLTYLRSTMSEQRLNNCLLLHIHKDITDSLDITDIGKQFICTPERRSYFGTF